MVNYDYLVGQKVWFPIDWEQATIDSVLTGGNNEIIAFILLRNDGNLVAIDMQTSKIKGYDDEL